MPLPGMKTEWKILFRVQKKDAIWKRRKYPEEKKCGPAAAKD
jgi:hypothetical protein